MLIPTRYSENTKKNIIIIKILFIIDQGNNNIYHTMIFIKF